MDNSALRAELEKHHRDSFGWALSCCAHNRSDAENVLQTVYLKVLEGKARFDGRSSLKTWLFSVIRRTANEEWRRRSFRRLWLKNNPEGTAGVESMETAIYRLELAQSLRTALMSLPKRQREVLQLVFYHDLTLAEAAIVMDVTLGSTRTHYERGKRRLRERMLEAGFYDGAKRTERDNPRVVPTTESVR